MFSKVFFGLRLLVVGFPIKRRVVFQWGGGCVFMCFLDVSLETEWFSGAHAVWTGWFSGGCLGGFPVKSGWFSGNSLLGGSGEVQLVGFPVAQ